MVVAVRRITADIVAAGRQVRASEHEPQYLLRSDANGSEAVHKPTALERR